MRGAIVGVGVAASLLVASPAVAQLVRGTSGPDELTGTENADRIYGLAGSDSLSGGDGNDRLFGGKGRDFILDGPGDDLANGGGGNDRFNAKRGADFINGGTGNDYVLLYHDGSADIVNCGPGHRDWVQYTGHLEIHDQFPGCERVEEYTP